MNKYDNQRSRREKPLDVARRHVLLKEDQTGFALKYINDFIGNG